MIPRTYIPSWFRYREERSDAVARLFCLPFAGGSSLTYRSWTANAPSEVEVCPIALPGRDHRRGEAPFVRMAQLVDALADGIEPLADLPFALFGHSMGSRVAFELARVLRERGLRTPIHLFVSGSRAPHFPSSLPDRHRMDDEALIGELRRMGGTPEEILRDAETMASLLPVLRADFEVLETYDFTGDDRIDCDITAFRGASDPFTSCEAIEAWGVLTTARFTHNTYPGDHFFLMPHGRAILAETAACMFRSLAEYRV